MRRSKKRGKAKQNKKLIWLAIAVLVVGIGFAALQKYLNINGNASIDSRFDVRINKIEVSEKNGSAYEKEDATFTDTTAKFNVGLINPGDSITYDVKVVNNGDLNAKLQELTIDQTGSSNIKYEITGISEGDIIAGDWNFNESSKTFKVKITYSGTSSEEYTKELSVKMLFVQTNDTTDEQISGIEEFQNSKSQALEDMGINEIDTQYNKIKLGSDWGDGPGNFDFDIIDADTDEVLVSNAGFKGITLNMYQTYNLKTINTRTINGEKIYSKASDVKQFVFATENTNTGNYIVNRSDNTVYGIVPGTVYNLTELLSGYSYKSGFLYNTNVDTVVIPGGGVFDLTKLPSFSLYRYSSANNGNGITKIVNLTGESIDWAPIVGAYSNGTLLNCSFVTGTCGNTQIVDNFD